MSSGSTRRRFLEMTGATVGMAGMGTPLAPAAGPRSAEPAEAGPTTRPKVAALATVYHYLSHAYHIVGRFIDGFPVYDGHGLHKPPFEIASLFIEQTPAKTDLGRAKASRHGIRQSPTIADALTLGTGKLAVDAVLLIAEHGDYPYNEKLQKLYPRGRFFREVLEVFKASGRAVPVFIDKHLSYSRAEAREMVAAGQGRECSLDGRLELAGHLAAAAARDSARADSSRTCVVASRGDLEIFGFHALETLQCMVERRDRRGKAQGVAAVTCLEGDAVWEAGDQGVWSWPLLEHALARSHTVNPGDIKQNTRDFMPPPAPGRDALTKLRHPIAFIVEYVDGLRATVLILNGHVDDTTIAARINDPAGGDTIVSTLMYLPAPPGASFFNPLVLRIEDFFRTRTAPLPRRADAAHGRNPRRRPRKPDQRSQADRDARAGRASITRRRPIRGLSERRSRTRSPIGCEPRRRSCHGTSSYRNSGAARSSRRRSGTATSSRCVPAGVVEGFPGGAHRGAAKLHAGLVGSSVGLPRIARNAGERTVFPGGLSSLSPRDHMVDRQFLGAGLASAILAGGMIAFEQVAAAEGHGLVPRPVVTGQGQDFGNAEVEPHGPDKRLSLARRELRPVRPAIELKVIGIDDESRLVPQHDQCTVHGGDVHWLPVAVQHESRSLQHTATHELRPLGPSGSGSGTPLPGRRAARAPAVRYLNLSKRDGARAAYRCYIEVSLIAADAGISCLSYGCHPGTRSRSPMSANRPMRAEIIAIGSELTSGQSLDTNSQWLSQQLSALGITVAFHTTLGDVLEDHLAVFRIACERADLVVMSGGLGPTQDDLTREALAQVAGVPLVEDRRFAGGDRRDVRPPQSRDDRAQPRPGPLSRGRRAVAQPGRDRARDLDAGRPCDHRLPARRPSRNEADVPGTGRSQTAPERLDQPGHRSSQDQPVRQGRIGDRSPGDGPDGPGPRSRGRHHRARLDHQLPHQRLGRDRRRGPAR